MMSNPAVGSELARRAEGPKGSLCSPPSRLGSEPVSASAAESLDCLDLVTGRNSNFSEVHGPAGSSELGSFRVCVDGTGWLSSGLCRVPTAASAGGRRGCPREPEVQTSAD